MLLAKDANTEDYVRFCFGRCHVILPYNEIFHFRTLSYDNSIYRNCFFFGRFVQKTYKIFVCEIFWF